MTEGAETRPTKPLDDLLSPLESTDTTAKYQPHRVLVNGSPDTRVGRGISDAWARHLQAVAKPAACSSYIDIS
jgi:hypothetical protein